MEVTVGLPSRQGQVGGTCECFIVDLAAANGSRATRFVMDNCDGVRPPGCDEALYVASDRLTVALHGYVSPGVILLTVVTNGFVCAVLRQPHMRSATNTLLVAMAIANTLTGVCPLPFFLNFYAELGGVKAYAEYIPERWCLAYIILADHLPTAFHTASVWLTLTLASQRYLYVCHAQRAQRYCTVRNALRATAVVFTLAGLSQLCRFFDSVIVPVKATSRLDGVTPVDACLQQLVPAVRQRVNTYFGIYYWFRVVFVYVLPCVLLVTLTSLLVNAMRRAAVRRRRLLLLGNRLGGGGARGRLSDSQATTLMLIAVVTSFLVTELPSAAIFVMFIVGETRHASIIEPQTQATVNLLVNLCILLSYPLNFVIYCAMSRQFRDTFRALFLPSCCHGNVFPRPSDKYVEEGAGGEGVTAASPEAVSKKMKVKDKKVEKGKAEDLAALAELRCHHSNNRIANCNDE